MLAYEEEMKSTWDERRKASFNPDHHITCDGAAAALLIDPDMGQYVDKYVFCDCVGEMTTGQTVIDWLGFAPFKNVKLPLVIDRDKFASLHLQCAGSYDKEGC